MNHTATPWSARVALGAVLVVGVAIAAAIPAAMPALVGGVLLGTGLFLAHSDNLRREAAGLGTAAVGVFTIGVGTIWSYPSGGTAGVPLATVSGAVAVAFGLVLVRDEDTGDRLTSTAATIGVTTVPLLIGAVVLTSTEGLLSVSGLGTTVLGLHDSRVSVGLFGLLLFLFGFSTFLAVRTLPIITILGPAASEDDAAAVADLRVYLGVLTAIFAVVAVGLWLLAQSRLSESGLSELVLTLLTSNTLIRVLLVVGILVSLLLVVAGVVMRAAWETDPDRVEAWGATVGGALLATAIVLPVAPVVVPAVASTGSSTAGASLMLASLIGIVSIILLVVASVPRLILSFVGLGLLAVVAVATSGDAVVAPLVALAGLLVAWDTISHGNSLATELGADAPTTQGELAHASASIGIAAFGVVVAIAVAYGRPLFEPLLVSGDATTSVVIGAVVIVVGAVLVAIE